MKIRHSLSALAIALLASGLHAEEANPAVSTPKFAYGMLLQHDGRVIFSPCRDRSYSIMEDVSPGHTVTQALNSIGLATGKKLYVELMAVVEGGALKASALNLAQVEGRCQLPGTSDEAWRAAGNEPGWILAAGGERIVLKRHGQADLSAPYLAAKQDGKAVVFAADHLSVRLENLVCKDSTGAAVFGWTASVTADDQALQGCAWQR
ncbi:hypothetical protein [Dechloromonas sp. A34]|uniref:hypothetical protein n=1 Tax=Dechloromonas sp. A34 TaxID=447588 RepID=UPI002249245D|nr:hypothetical protein [Dechloromonas sp. A34]